MTMLIYEAFIMASAVIEVPDVHTHTISAETRDLIHKPKNDKCLNFSKQRQNKNR